MVRCFLGMTISIEYLLQKGVRSVNTELKNAVKATDSKAQYDTSAKRLLGQKSILAHILVKTVDEFKGMNPKDVVECIEGTPYISTVPVEPGLTNTVREKKGKKLVGFNTENGEVNEGLIRFDIVFYVRMKDGLSQIIINVEAQKDEPKGYEILNRAIFYVSRLISSQKERDFENSSYNDIKRVYSIWVCMNMDENSMSHVHLTKEDLIGSYEWKGNEYDIPIEENFRRDVSVMCNLSQGIKEDGIAIGEAGLIMKMYKNGFTAEQIASATDKDIEEVKAIIAEKEPALV